MILELEPLDTLFFKDGKPFSMGEETWAETIFPPYPSTIYGALRTAWFNENIKEFEKLDKEDFNSKKDPTIQLKIKNIFIKKGNEFLFIIPRDILCNKNKKFQRLKLEESFLSSVNNVKLLMNPEDEIFSYESIWISLIQIKKYLSNNLKVKYISNISKSNNIFEYESKVGIARDRIKHSAKDGHLYRVNMLRLKEEVKIYVDFEGLKFKNLNFLKLGGEGKYVKVFINNKKNEINIPTLDIEKKFLIYLSTPAIFKKGWLPDWIDENTLEGIIFKNLNLKVKLITVAIGKPKFIGGFDIAEGKPKPMYKAVPEGSVYYFEIIEGDKDILKKIHGKSISDIYPEQGFGICYIGKY